MLSDGVLVCGVRFVLSADHPSALAELRAALAEPTPTPERTGLVLSVAAAPLSRPLRSPDVVLQHIELWHEANSTTVSAGRGTTARITEAGAVLDPGGQGARGHHALLLPVLTELLHRCGLHVVHAGGFLRSRSAVLVLGGSGAGKSTVVTSVVAAGATVLSDDLVALRLGDTDLEACGVPQPMLAPGDLNVMDGLGTPVPHDVRGRRILHAGDLADRGWHPVSESVAVAHGQERGRLAAVSPSEVLHLVMRSSLHGLHSSTVSRIFPVAAAVARLPSARLELARDPGRRAADVQDCLLAQS